MIPFEDKLYLISMGSKSKTSNFIEYSLSSGKYNIIDSYETGGQMITRMGRFVYFTERNVTGQDDTGKLEYVLALHRYDLESGKTDYLGTIPGNRDFLKPTAYNGEIYYIDAYELYKCDYNLRYAQKISGNHKVKIFEIRDNTVWFLTETKDKRGGLYRRDLSGGETELVYEDVTWFSLDGDTLYYSLYDPVDAFEWDIWMQTKDGNGKMLVTEMITVHNGNKVYRISLDKAGKKGAEAPFCKALPENGIYLSDAYAVYNGMMICDFRGPYSDGSRKGLSSGKAVIRAETGEIIRITSEDFFLDGQVFPYKEQTES